MENLKNISLKVVFYSVATIIMGTAVGSVSYLTSSKYKEDYISYMKAFYAFFFDAIAIMSLMCLVVFGIMYILSKIYKAIFK